MDCSVSSTPVESFRIKKAAGMIDERDENPGNRWARMIAISETAANHQQTCELCQSLASADDDNFLTLMTGKKYWTVRPMKRSDITMLTFGGRSLSGGGGFGGVEVTCSASVVARINGILRIGNILGSWKCQGSRNLLATPHTYIFYFSRWSRVTPYSTICQVRRQSSTVKHQCIICNHHFI